MCMNYKKVLTIQDISCVGQCSLTVALPILSACGMETVILPSAVLSTHTGGFRGFTFRDLTDDIPKIEEHWKNENIRFNAIYTGYLGSTRQIEMVSEILRTMGADDCISFVDPAMADGGRLYTGFDSAFVEEMKKLAFSADFLLPNITEACFLTDTEYRSEYDRAYIDTLISKMKAAGAKNIILTGVSYGKATTGIEVVEGEKRSYYEHILMPKGCHGTGDIYASAFVGAMMNGNTAFDSAKIAADYTVKCIENTQGDESHWYGAKFETALPDLIRMLDR